MSTYNNALNIIKRLNKKGFEAYIVGGAARDLILKITPNDFDIATNASHEEIMEIFSNRKRAVVGSDFKICLVDGIEIATYRSDSKNSKIEDDLKKRDFTINSLAYDPLIDKFIDFSNGISDIKQGIISFNGSPMERIEEDPLRIVRACRFLSKLDGRFSDDTLKALTINSYKIKDIAKERFKIELMKSLETKKPGIFFDALHKIGALKYISPNFERCYGLDGGPFHGETVDEHINMTGNRLSPKKPLLRLAGFFHDHGKPDTFKCESDGKVSFIDHENKGSLIVENELNDLKFSIKETDYVKNLVKFHMRDVDESSSGKSVRKLLKDFSDNNINWKDWLNLKIADRYGNKKKIDYSKKEIKDIVLKIHSELKPENYKSVLSLRDLKIDGNDIIEHFKIKSGPKLGILLNLALDYVIEHPVNNNKKILIEYLNKHIMQTEVEGADKKL